MGIEALIGSLVTDGVAEASRIRAAALEESDRILADARAQAGATRDDARALEEKALRARVAEVLFAARREGRRRVLTAREQALERVRTAALRTLANAHDDPRLRPLVATLVQNAVGYLPDEAGVALCHPALEPEVRRALGEASRVRCTGDAEVAPGVVLRDAAGRLEVQETLPVRLERSWPMLRMQLTRAIAGDA